MDAEMIAAIIAGAVVLLALYKKFFQDAKAGNGRENALPASVSQWTGRAKKWASFFDVPWQIIVAQIWQESSGDPKAVGRAGEVGLMQIKQIAIDDLKQRGYEVPENWFSNPESNIAAGVMYLDLQKKRAGNIVEALKAYNQGYQGARQNPIAAQNYAESVLKKAKKIGYTV